MNYRVRLVLLVLLDSIIVSSALLLATWVVYPQLELYQSSILWMTAIAIFVLHHFYAFIFKLYHRVWSYASIGELLAIAQSVTLTILSAGIFQFFMNDFSVYRRALFVTWLLHMILIGGSRFVWRMYRDRFITKTARKKRTLIVGAGDAGAMIVRQLISNHNGAELWPVAFVDDDLRKQRMELFGLRVLGLVQDIPKVVNEQKIEHIVIAIPSMGASDLQKIVDQCHQTNVKVQMIPKIEDLMTGKVTVNSLKNVEVEDLLGRDPVDLDLEAISYSVAAKTIMVTGAGGSIGSELCRQLMSFSPEKIILVGRGEYSIYKIDLELKEKFKDTETEIIALIGDVQDRKRIFEIVKNYRPSIIYHAAAHKHVPLMELNPHEAVKNNIIGTKNVAEAVDAYGVDTFVLVSTDKAVNPTNVMGATKRIAEMVIQQLDQSSSSKFVAVRFGNVLGSRGSVIPLFKRQIEKGGPVTVTDPEMTRYFMTIPEASRLVIQAGTLANGGEVFVLDMGEPVKIIDLAKNLIKLSGYTEDEVPIEFTGIRPGEKMFEELLNENEILPDAVYEKIYVGRTVEVDEHLVNHLIRHYDQYNHEKLKSALMRIVFMEKELMTKEGS